MATRKPPPARTRRTEPLPVDVRVTHAAADLLWAVLVVVLAVGAALWLLRWPGFALRSVQLQGELVRTHLPTLRAQVAPRLGGNFFSVDLQQLRTAFEGVPWVRRAVVRRVWPNGLVVRLEEHRPAALWQGSDSKASGDHIVNDLGEVFEASAGDLEDPAASATVPGSPAAVAAVLPTLAGPAGSSAAMLSLYRRLVPVLAEVDQQIETLELSDRGSWRAETRSGAVIEIGRGSEEQVVARTTQFVRTVAEATDRWQAPLEMADLRHSDGYAVRLRGISVSSAASAAAANKTN